MANYRKTLKSAIFATAEFGCLYAWQCHGVEGAGNVLFAWSMLVAGLVALAVLGNVALVLGGSRAVPLTVTTFPGRTIFRSLDLLLIVLLTWYAQYLMAGAFLAGWLLVVVCGKEGGHA